MAQNGAGNFFKVAYNEDILEIFLFEEYSFEEAYKITLDMKEESPLCYSPNNF